MAQKFLSLLGGAPVETRKGKTRRTGRGARGCDVCPMSEKPKLKGFDRLSGRRAMLWVNHPGKADMEHRTLANGRTGDLLWDVLKPHGLGRDDFDMQAVVRCRPTRKIAQDSGLLRVIDRGPTKDEYRCCSLYNAQALEHTQGAAHTWLVLGRETAQNLLSKEYGADHPIFHSQAYGAQMFCLPDPATFNASTQDTALEIFERQIDAFAYAVKHPGRWRYLREQDYGAVFTAKQTRRLLRKLSRSRRRVAVDIEDDVVDGKRVLLCIGFSNRTGWARTVYVDHPLSQASAEDRRQIKRLLKRFLEGTETRKTLHNGAYDAHRLKEILGIRIRRFDFDTLYSSFLLRPDELRHGLDALSYRVVPKFAGYKKMVAKWSGRYRDIPLKRMTLYNCADADLTGRLEREHRERVPANLLRTYIATSHTLRAMEQRGPILDTVHHAAVQAYLPKRVKQLERRLKLLAGDPGINVRSNDAIAHVLYDVLDIDIPIDKYGNAVRSTRKEFLKRLSDVHEFPRILMEFRKLDVLETRYLDKFLASANRHDGEVHTKWHLTGAATGRLRSGGSKDAEAALVNLQNIATDPMVKNLLVSDENWRRVLVPADNWLDLDVFLSYDYGQIEIRMLAEVSQDPLLLRQLQDTTWDIHCHVGHELTGWDHQRIKDDEIMRRAIKAIHFGIIYGLGVRHLWMKLRSEGVKISERKVQQLRDAYFARYKRVVGYINEKRRMAEELHCVDTIFGFVRPINEEDERGTYWGNQAINTPIQGAAHQLMLNAMALLHLEPGKFNLLQKPLMEVHDALVFRAKVRNLVAAFQQGVNLLTVAVPEYCERVFNHALSVPLTSECKAGFRYGSMVVIDGDSPDAFRAKWLAKNAEVEAKVAKSMKRAA